MAADRTGGWEDVRRALGRLVGRATSHTIPVAGDGISVGVRPPVPLTPTGGGTGGRQSEWRPAACIGALSLPLAFRGGDGVDLAAVATTIGANRALKTHDVRVTEAECHYSQAPAVHAGPVAQSVPGIHAASVGIVRGPITRPRLVGTAPPVRAALFVRVEVPKSRPLGQTPWQFTKIRTRTDLAAVLRVPLTCHRLPAPAGSSIALEFVSERRMLAASAGVPEADVALIGVFPHVPLGAIQRLTVVPDGTALKILLSPANPRQGSVTATVTLVLGRQRSTGRMLQALRRVPGPTGTEPGRS